MSGNIIFIVKLIRPEIFIRILAQHFIGHFYGAVGAVAGRADPVDDGLRLGGIGLRRLADEWLCILVTPWFMNVMLLPASTDDGAEPKAATPGAVGSKALVAFPAGRFETIRGYEAGIGHYRMCSLFSPMHEFADHENAVIKSTFKKQNSRLYLVKR